LQCVSGKSSIYVHKSSIFCHVMVNRCHFSDPEHCKADLAWETFARGRGTSFAASATMAAECLALKNESRILGHSSHPVCGFSVMEQVRLCAVGPWRTGLDLPEPHTRMDHCPRVLLWCFRARTFEWRTRSSFAVGPTPEMWGRQDSDREIGNAVGIGCKAITYEAK